MTAGISLGSIQNSVERCVSSLADFSPVRLLSIHLGSVTQLASGEILCNRSNAMFNVISREAQRLTVEVRIPHHALVARWLDRRAVAQIVWIGVGVALTWRTRLFPMLAIAEFIGVFKLVRGCVALPFTLLTALSYGALFVLLVIATYTGVFLAALVERM